MDNWPPYSPDMNPIEHLWCHLKRLVYEVRPDTEDVRGEEAIGKALAEALNKAWQLIEDDIIDSLVESMPRRVDTLIKAKGWHTNY